MNWIIESLQHALGMFWLMLWPLVFGLTLSAFLQVFVSAGMMQSIFGQTGARSVALATGFGAASSSCSYAAVTTAKTVFQRGAALVPTLAFMFAATNLVIELGILLWQIMGWVFVAAEVVGGLVMILIMWLLVVATKPADLEESARNHLKEANRQDQSGGHHHHSHSDESSDAGEGFGHRLVQAESWRKIGGVFFMEIQMLWKELLIGLLVAGLLSVIVPGEWWQTLFLNDGPSWLQVIENAAVGPLIAMGSFVCSDGNVPLASLLWANGISFGGVVAFIYGDLLIIPLILLYRKYFGWRTALYITGWLYVSMVFAGILVDIAFTWLHLVPGGSRPDAIMNREFFAWDLTTWLNLGAIALLLVFAILKRQTTAHGSVTEQHSCG